MIRKSIFILLIFFSTIIFPASGGWTSDSSVVNGIPSIWRSSTPTVYVDSGTWKLISGSSDGTFIGFDWNGTSWVSNASVVSGLVDVGSLSTPTVYEDSGTLKLISGEVYGDFVGYYWSGSAWVSDSGIVSGLVDNGDFSTPTVYDDAGTLKLIAGGSASTLKGYYWGGSSWVSDSSVVTGTGSTWAKAAPEVYNDYGLLKLVCGQDLGGFLGFYWNGSSWISDSTNVSGLDGVTDNSAPAVFNDSGTFKLIAGEFLGNYYGFYEGYLAPSLSGQTPSTPVNDTTGNSRTFNATSDQTSNNKWLLNGSSLEWDNGTTAPSYTNTSAQTGTWNVSLIAYNSSDSSLSDTMMWTWNVSAPSPTPTPTETAIIIGGGGGGEVAPAATTAELNISENVSSDYYVVKPVNTGLWFLILLAGIGLTLYGFQTEEGELLFSGGLVCIVIAMIKLGIL